MKKNKTMLVVGIVLVIISFVCASYVEMDENGPFVFLSVWYMIASFITGIGAMGSFMSYFSQD